MRRDEGLLYRGATCVMKIAYSSMTAYLPAIQAWKESAGYSTVILVATSDG